MILAGCITEVNARVIRIYEAIEDGDYVSPPIWPTTWPSSLLAGEPSTRGVERLKPTEARSQTSRRRPARK